MSVQELIDILQSMDKTHIIRCYPGASPVVAAIDDLRMGEVALYLGPYRNPEELKKI